MFLVDVYWLIYLMAHIKYLNCYVLWVCKQNKQKKLFLTLIFIYIIFVYFSTKLRKKTYILKIFYQFFFLKKNIKQKKSFNWLIKSRVISNLMFQARRPGICVWHLNDYREDAIFIAVSFVEKLWRIFVIIIMYTFLDVLNAHYVELHIQEVII